MHLRRNLKMSQNKQDEKTHQYWPIKASFFLTTKTNQLLSHQWDPN